MDVGAKIIVNNDLDPAAVLAALKVGAEKWGSVKVSGAADYIKLCNKLARENGIRITKKSRKPTEDDAPRPEQTPSPMPGGLWQRRCEIRNCSRCG
ncbi:MAG: hypothetical protein LBN33_05430, partial [Desulfovibrio sp.]|nr:hypothetical protein [Desulfovibrio sp.]